MVEKWDNFPKFGLGKQITNAADSISSNIAEGYGRFFLKRILIFVFTAEVLYWKQKTGYKNLLEEI